MDPKYYTLLNCFGIGILLLLEARSKAFRSIWSDRRRMKRNVLYLISSLSAGLVLHWTVSVISPALPKYHLQAALVWHLCGAFLLGELCNWVIHWAKHKNPFLWRLHCQHHRDDRFTVWLVTHTYAPEVLISGTTISCLILACGFSQYALDVYLLFYSIVNVYQHSSNPYSLGILDKLIVNPAYHRHHHGGAQMNYGSALSVWDWVFSTVIWPKDRHVAIEPPPVASSPEPFGYVDELLYPLVPSRWVPSAMDLEEQNAQSPYVTAR